jgi:hypothetical protein
MRDLLWFLVGYAILITAIIASAGRPECVSGRHPVAFPHGGIVCVPIGQDYP